MDEWINQLFLKHYSLCVHYYPSVQYLSTWRQKYFWAGVWTLNYVINTKTALFRRPWFHYDGKPHNLPLYMRQQSEHLSLWSASKYNSSESDATFLQWCLAWTRSQTPETTASAQYVVITITTPLFLKSRLLPTRAAVLRSQHENLSWKCENESFANIALKSC